MTTLTPDTTPTAPSALESCASCFDLEQSPALTPAALGKMASGLAEHRATRSPGESAALAESWGPDSRVDDPGVLASHFMERFAAISQRLPGGLAFTAISTLRLEHPLRQQEDFNRSCLMLADWALREAERAQARFARLEDRVASLERRLGLDGTQHP